MELLTRNTHLQIESDREPWLCGVCNYYADCYIRREEDEPELLSRQYKYCHEDRKEKSYLPDDDLALIYDEEMCDWECDCDENYSHFFPSIQCDKCGIRYDDPTE
jgi:hypothetical protein